MAEFVEVMKQRNRICDGYECDGGCPLNLEDISCGNLMRNKPQEAEKIIMDWAKENPEMTRQEKFKEVFGFKPNYRGCPLFDTDECKHKCAGCAHDNFWNEEWKDPKEKV